MSHMYNWDTTWWLMTLWMFIFWGLLLGSLVMSLRYIFNPNHQHVPHPAHHPHSALDILQMRYARGEITRDEYLRLRADIKEPRAN